MRNPITSLQRVDQHWSEPCSTSSVSPFYLSVNVGRWEGFILASDQNLQAVDLARWIQITKTDQNEKGSNNEGATDKLTLDQTSQVIRLTHAEKEWT